MDELREFAQAPKPDAEGRHPLTSWVMERPVQALLIALTGGVVVGWLIKRP